MRKLPKLAIITTCMGRKEHIQKSSAQLMKDPRIGKEILWVLVDYACPEKTGEWAKKEYGDRVHVLEILEPPVDPKDTRTRKGNVFNKPLALNSGAMDAIAEGAEYLAFMDADTIVSKGFLDHVLAAGSLDNFLIVSPDLEKRDLTGFLCVSHRHFLRAGGYDISFVGWGAEDLEMRLKLYLRTGVPFSEIPSALATSIPHKDDVRTVNYEEKDKDASHNTNLNLLCANAFHWSGKHLIDLYGTEKGPYIRRLLGIEQHNPKALL